MTTNLVTDQQSGETAPSVSHPSSSPTNDPTSLYRSLHSYPFESDSAFLSGLASILGHPGVPATKDEIDQKPDLVLQAKCFYYSRKVKTTAPINVAGYKTWLASRTSDGLESTTSTLSNVNLNAEPVETSSTTQPQQQSEPTATPAGSTPSTQTQVNSDSTSNTQSDAQPPYPTSFAEIVDLITNNKPIPGIQEIPTTVLELGSSKRDTATRRRKPWEKDTDADVHTPALGAEPSLSKSELGTNTAVEGKEDAETDGDTTTERVEEGKSSGLVRVSEMSRYRGKDEGLLRILRPDAVPDSGLIAKE